MKMFRLLIAVLFLPALTAFAAFAQTQTTPTNKPQPQPVQSGKIGLINTAAFDDDKAGIAKYTNGMNSVDAIFKPELDGLNVMVVKIQSLEKELTDLQNKLNVPVDPKVPVGSRGQLQTTYNTKLEEYEKSGREYKFKQDDLKIRYQRKQQEVMGPILRDIGNAIQEFAKQKGYTIVLDAAKLIEMGALLAIDEKIDLTKDFIVFYNARQTTPATK